MDYYNKEFQTRVFLRFEISEMRKSVRRVYPTSLWNKKIALIKVYPHRPRLLRKQMTTTNKHHNYTMNRSTLKRPAATPPLENCDKENYSLILI